MKKLIKLFLVALIGSTGAATAQDAAKLEDLQNQIADLQRQVSQMGSGKAGGVGSHGLSFDFYGEFKWIRKNHSADKFDPHRFVLIPKYELSENARFVSEIEIEHGGAAGGDRLDGYVALEQFYLEWEINESLKPRFGVNLIPVGTINEVHEPNTFYSVHRPIMYKYIIPTTWMESGVGLYGDLPQVTDGLSYKLFLSSGLSSAQGGASKLVDGTFAPRNHRPSSREADGNDSFAISGKLAYAKGGFSGSVSTYRTSFESAQGSSDMQLYDIEGKYRFQNGLELIADYAWWDIEDPAKILSDYSATGQTGDKMDGYRLEVAYHLDHGANEVVPFFRFEGYDLESGPKGSSFNYLTYGAMYGFGRGAAQKWELKAGVRQSLDDDQSTEYTLGVGMQF
tara:strand:+ start:1899 stop:3086 length:1188 start_codon:yes stop_codon:yes gene_type:complete